MHFETMIFNILQTQLFQPSFEIVSFAAAINQKKVIFWTKTISKLSRIEWPIVTK